MLSMLGEDRMNIKTDLGVQPPHEFNINLLQRVSSRLQEVNASMDTVVDNLLTVNSVLLFEIRVEAGFNVLQDGFPAANIG